MCSARSCAPVNIPVAFTIAYVANLVAVRYSPLTFLSPYQFLFLFSFFKFPFFISLQSPLSACIASSFQIICSDTSRPPFSCIPVRYLDKAYLSLAILRSIQLVFPDGSTYILAPALNHFQAAGSLQMLVVSVSRGLIANIANHEHRSLGVHMPNACISAPRCTPRASRQESAWYPLRTCPSCGGPRLQLQRRFGW
jgi:hypothetical protein